MYFEKSFAIFMGGFVVWGFLMAMLFNFMLFGFKAKKDLKLVWVSIVMFISYFISDHFYDVFGTTTDIYLTWFMYDLVTLSLLLPILFVSKSKISSGSTYVILGLLINSMLFLSMHLDIAVKGNREEWWLWNLYSIGINVVDFFMIVVLIVDRDIFGIIKLSNLARVKLMKFRKRIEMKYLTTMKTQGMPF